MPVPFEYRATGEVAVLALLPEFEGQGIARKLLGLVMQALAGAGHTELFLGCSANPDSRSYGCSIMKSRAAKLTCHFAGCPIA